MAEEFHLDPQAKGSGTCLTLDGAMGNFFFFK